MKEKKNPKKEKKTKGSCVCVFETQSNERVLCYVKMVCVVVVVDGGLRVSVTHIRSIANRASHPPISLFLSHPLGSVGHTYVCVPYSTDQPPPNR